MSPIVGGQAVSGPAAKLLTARGLDVSPLGVARAYRPWLDALVMDRADAAHVRGPRAGRRPAGRRGRAHAGRGGRGPARPRRPRGRRSRRVKVVVVPAKEFTIAKQRLADALPAAARAALARAMLEDVLAALAGAPVDRVVVITPDAEVAAVAERWGALVVRETEGHGHTAAVARGVALCREWGATVLLTVPGDLPCLTADEVRRILDACGPAPAAVFVPSRSGLGTNAACLTPPDAVPLRFGEPSFADHLAAARARGIEPVVLPLPGAGLDIDRPEDLDALRQAGPGTRAAADARRVGRRAPAARPAARGLRDPRPPGAPARGRSREPRAGGGRRPGHAARVGRRRRAQPEGRLQGRGPAGAARRRLAVRARDRGRARSQEGSPADRDHPPRVAPDRADGPRYPDHRDAPRPDLRQRGRRPVERGPRLGEPPPRGPRRVGAGLRGPRARRRRASRSR